MKKIIYMLLVAFLGLNCLDGFGQVKKQLSEGNKAYLNGDFEGARERYEEAMSEEKGNAVAHFNAGNALYREENYEEAVEQFYQAAETAPNNKAKAEAYHNMGNANMSQQKLPEAIDAYKKALRHNPKDEDARFNLSQALRMKKQQDEQEKQEGEDGEEGDENDENQENEDQEKKEGDDEGDKKDGENEDNQEEGEEDKKDKNDEGEKKNEKDEPKPGDQEKETQPAEPKNQISKDAAERILNSMDREENKTRARVAAELSKGKKGEKRKIEKDW